MGSARRTEMVLDLVPHDQRNCDKSEKDKSAGRHQDGFDLCSASNEHERCTMKPTRGSSRTEIAMLVNLVALLCNNQICLGLQASSRRDFIDN
jgi:hypothetical protein